MGYAIQANGSFRAVEPDWVLLPGETYSETLPEPPNAAQQARQPAINLLSDLRRELALAEIASDGPKINKIRREISRVKFMSQGV